MKRFNMTKRAIEGTMVINFLICATLQRNRVWVSKLRLEWDGGMCFGAALGFLIKVKISSMNFFALLIQLHLRGDACDCEESSQCPSYFILCNTP